MRSEERAVVVEGLYFEAMVFLTVGGLACTRPGGSLLEVGGLYCEGTLVSF